MSGRAPPGASATHHSPSQVFPSAGNRASRQLERPPMLVSSVARGGLRELSLAFALSLVAVAALLGSHVANGGRYLDDWWLGVYVRFPHALGFGSAYDYLKFYSGARPGGVAYWLLTYKVFGFHDDLQREFGLLLAAGLATVFYFLLRELRLRPFEATAVTGLSLALPIADSIHFWMTPDVAQLCLGTCVAGYVAALRGLRSSGRSARRFRLAGLGLFVMSILIAETMIPAIGLSVLIYRSRAGWRRAITWWAADLVLVGVAGVHYAVSEPTRLSGATQSESYLHHSFVLADQAVTLFTGALVPVANSRVWALCGLLVLACALAVRRRRASYANVVHAAARRWVVVSVVAAVFAAASYAIYVPADPSYQPLVSGVGNRVNIGALLPLSVLLFAVIRLIGSLFGTPRRAVAVSLGLWAVVLVGGVTRLTADQWLWDQAANHQRAVLSAVHDVLPDPPPGASLLVFNSPGVVTHFERVGETSVNEPVPVFSTWWELDAAVKMSYGRADIDAYPIWAYQPPQVACGAHYVYQLGLDSGRVRHALAYGAVYVVDVATPSVRRLDDQRECESVIARARTIRYDLPV